MRRRLLAVVARWRALIDQRRAEQRAAHDREVADLASFHRFKYWSSARHPPERTGGWRRLR